MCMDIEGLICRVRIRQERGIEIRSRLEELVKRETRVSDILLLQLHLATLYLGNGEYTQAKNLAVLCVPTLRSISGSERDPTDGRLAWKFMTLLETLELDDEARSILTATTTNLKKRIANGEVLQDILRVVEATQTGSYLRKYRTTDDPKWLMEAEVCWGAVNRLSEASLLNPLEKLRMQAWHGEISAANRRWEDAVKETEPLYLHLRDSHGMTDREYLDVAINLANYLFFADKTDMEKPLRVLDDTIKETTARLGTSHPTVLELQCSKANILRIGNQSALAITILEEALRRYDDTANANRPIVIDAQYELAWCYRQLPNRSEDDLDKAIALYSEVFDRYENIERGLKPAEKSTAHLSSGMSLGNTLAEKGRPGEGAAVMLKVLDMKLAKLGI